MYWCKMRVFTIRGSDRLGLIVWRVVRRSVEVIFQVLTDLDLARSLKGMEMDLDEIAVDRCSKRARARAMVKARE